jgi:tRNA1Val (adenine37-N6)-methyltransferase
MPTSLQSAPARCEFRGGIENYCAAAASVLATDGTFVVCENWLNNDRVYQGAKDAGLQILRVFPIKGTVRKKQNLFAVYVMGVEKANKDVSCKVLDPVSVRAIDGKWTKEYEEIMASMSIPCRHNEAQK